MPDIVYRMPTSGTGTGIAPYTPKHGIPASILFYRPAFAEVVV